MTSGGVAGALDRHVRDFFDGHSVETAFYDLGNGTRGMVGGMRIMEIGPGPRGNFWTYVTAGCWERANHHGHGLEFVLTAPVSHPRFADVLSMTAYYHCGGAAPHTLDLGHSVPLGEPVTPGSTCEHLLVSLPYLHGPDLEMCALPNGHARLLWLQPVTASEIAFRREHGTEALEQLFEDAGIDPVDLGRPAVV